MTSIKVIKKTKKTLQSSDLINEINDMIKSETDLYYDTKYISKNISDMVFDYKEYKNNFRISEIDIINLKKLLKYECVLPVEHIVMGGDPVKTSIDESKLSSVELFIDNETVFYKMEKHDKYVIRKSLLDQRNYDIFDSNFYIIKDKTAKIKSLIINFNKFITNNKKYLYSNNYRDEIIACNFSNNIYNIFQSYICNSIYLNSKNIKYNYKDDKNMILIESINNEIIKDLLIFFNNLYEFFNNYILVYSYNSILNNILYINEKSLILKSKSYKYIYDLHNPYFISPIKSDKTLRNNYVSDNMKKIIKENKLLISTSNRLSFLNDSSSYYNKFLNNLILLNLNIDVDRNYKYLQSLHSHTHIHLKQSDNEISDKLLFYKITNLFIEKYGFDEYKKIYHKALDMNIIKSSLNYKSIDISNVISKNILKSLQEELKKEEILNTKKNVFPWLQLYSDFKLEKFTKTRLFLYKKLREYIPKKYLKSPDSLPYTGTLPTTEYINIDGIDIICPHLKDKYELLIKKFNETEINNYIVKFYAHLGNNFNNVCNICGEILSRSKMLYSLSYSASTSEYSQVLGELKQKMFKKTMMMVYSFIDHKGDNLFNKQLTNSVVNELYPFIRDLEIKLSKIRNYSQEIMNYRLDLFMSIYIYAYFTRFYIANFPNIKLKYLSVYTSLQSKNLITIKNETINQIIRFNNFNITKIQDSLGLEITKKYISELYSKAIKNISGIDEKIKKEIEDPNIYMSYFLYSNVMYSLLSFSHIIQNMKNKDISYKNYIFQILPKSLNSINVLGENIKQLTKKKYLLENVKNPLQSTKITEHSGNTNKYSIIESFGKKYYDEILYNIVEYILKYSQKYYKISPFVVSKKAEVVYNQELFNFKKEKLPISNAYDFYRKQFLFSFAKPFNNISKNQTPKIFNSYHDEKFLYLNYIYGYKNINKQYAHSSIVNKFHKHKWDIGLYVKLQMFNKHRYNLKKYTEKDITMINKKNINMGSNLIFIGSICEICYNTKNDFYPEIKEKTNEYFVHESFNNLIKKMCPEKTSSKYGENPFHDFKEDVCKLCKYKINTDASEAYYTKYIKVFKKYLFHERNIKTSHKFEKFDYKITKYNINYQSILNEFISFCSSIKNSSKNCDDSYKISKLSENEIIYNIKNVGLFDNIVMEESIKSKKDLQKNKTGITNIKNLVLYFNSVLSKIKNGIHMYTDTVLNENNKLLNDISIEEIHKETINKFGKYVKFNVFCYDLLNSDEDITQNYEIAASYLFLYLINLHKKISQKSGKNKSECIILYMLNQLYLSNFNKSKLSDREITKIKTGYIIEDKSNIIDNRMETSYDDLIDEDVISEFSYESIDYNGENDLGADDE